MAGNTFGNIFKLTTFGESHGPAIGGVIDGCPSGLKIDLDAIEKEAYVRGNMTFRNWTDSITGNKLNEGKKKLDAKALQSSKLRWCGFCMPSCSVLE